MRNEQKTSREWAAFLIKESEKWREIERKWPENCIGEIDALEKIISEIRNQAIKEWLSGTEPNGGGGE